MITIQVPEGLKLSVIKCCKKRPRIEFSTDHGYRIVEIMCPKCGEIVSAKSPVRNEEWIPLQDACHTWNALKADLKIDVELPEWEDEYVYVR